MQVQGNNLEIPVTFYPVSPVVPYWKTVVQHHTQDVNIVKIQIISITMIPPFIATPPSHPRRPLTCSCSPFL